MLPAAHRLRRSSDFRRTVRQGRRVTAPTVVVHAVTTSPARPARVGFIVSKELGRATRRNLVKRRLRRLVADRLESLAGVEVVVRARPDAADADYARLRADIGRCLDALEEGTP